MSREPRVIRELKRLIAEAQKQSPEEARKKHNAAATLRFIKPKRLSK